MRLIPKNWDSFQHYKNRRPPWIKLHKSMLDDRVFMSLPTASKALAPLLWLLASEQDTGEFDASTDELQFRLRMSRDDIEKGLRPLIDKGFFIVASGSLAECVQVAVPEERREEKRQSRERGETEKEETRKRAAYPCPDDVDPQTWSDWLALRKAKKAPVTETVVNGAIREAGKAGMGLEAFLRIWCTRGSQGLQADWLRPSERSAGASASAESFRERDERLARQKYAEMVGRPVVGEIIDVTPNNLGIEDASD